MTMTGSLFLRYAEARIAFDADPSPRHETAIVAAFVAWVEDYAPDCAERATELFRRKLAADLAKLR
jgi:hypothetical protein